MRRNRSFWVIPQLRHMICAHFLPPDSLALVFSLRFLVSFLARRPGPSFFPRRPARRRRYFGSNFFILSRFSYMSPKPVLRPPPNMVLKPKSWMHWESCTLYIEANFFARSCLETFAKFG